MTEKDVKVICLTPVKNEAWILDRFLQCTSLWADQIIIADQGSTDGSQEIARKHPKVQLIHNEANQFQGTSMRRLLLHESRKISGKKLLIALDADEVFASTLLQSEEWQKVQRASAGTKVFMKIANLYPDFTGFYSDDAWYYIGFMDDGFSNIEGGVLHESRLPFLENNPVIKLEGSRFLHYNYLHQNRNASKLRWYMCYERVINHRKTFDILNQYYPHHHPEYLSWKQRHYPLNPIALTGYQHMRIDMTTIPLQQYFWWDEAVLNYFQDCGIETFKDLDIWYVDWNKAAKELGMSLRKEVKSPQGFFDQMALVVFKGVQQHPQNLFYRAGYRFLRSMNY